MENSPIQIKMLKSRDNLLTAKVNLFGGVLTSLNYQVESGILEPVFYQAPWLNETDIQSDYSIPKLLKKLSGEWVGIPFGGSPCDHHGFYVNAPHGLPVISQWSCNKYDDNQIELVYCYPDDHLLQKLIRTIKLADDGLVLFTLSIIPRKNCRFPIGLHPIFPFGENIGKIEINIPNFQKGITYFTQTEVGVSRLASALYFDSLQKVPINSMINSNEKYIDISSLPLPFDTEEIVQIIRPQYGVKLRYPQRFFEINFQWDTQYLPDCLLWISNHGRKGKPWLSRNYCLGVEPICSAWDIGYGSLLENPINQFSPTVIDFESEQPVTIKYSIKCEII